MKSRAVAVSAESPTAHTAGRGQSEKKRDAGNKHDTLLDRRGETTLEHFRRIYLSMQSADDRDRMPVIGITSSVEGEGRTTIATGVAAAMAADLDAPVVLVEADLTHPGVHHILGVAPEPGICEFLRGECELATALRQVSDRFFVLPAGDARGEASRLIRQLTTADLRTRLDSSGALMVLDLPPILSYSYGVLAATMAEALAFVVRAGQTTNTQVRDALSRLDDSMVRGIVLNAAQTQLPRWLVNS